MHEDFSLDRYRLFLHRKKGAKVVTVTDTAFGFTRRIEGTFILFHGRFDTQRDKGFFKSNISKEGFIDLNRIKRCVSEKSFGMNQQMLLEKVG